MLVDGLQVIHSDFLVQLEVSIIYLGTLRTSAIWQSWGDGSETELP